MYIPPNEVVRFVLSRREGYLFRRICRIWREIGIFDAFVPVRGDRDFVDELRQDASIFLGRQ